MAAGAGSKPAWLNRRVLSNRLLVGVGLISYPLYLWHWPLLSFARILDGATPSRTVRIAAVAASFVLAYLTYIWLEKPLRYGTWWGKWFRASQHPRGYRWKIGALCGLMAVVGFVGYNAYVRDGLTFRSYSQKNLNGDTGHIEFHKYIANKYFLCGPKEILDKALKWDVYTRCMQSKRSDQIDIAIVGDSHAEHLFIGMAEALPNKNIVFYIKSSPPFLDNSDFIKIYESVIKNEALKAVILTMHWMGRVSQIPKESTLDKELLKVIDVLSSSGKAVYLIDDVPAFPFDPEKCEGRRRFGSTNECKIPLSIAKSQSEIYLDSLMKVVENRPSVRLLSVGKYLCDNESCSMAADKFILYRDRNHLNINGSSLVGRRLVEDNLQLFKSDLNNSN